MSGILGHRGILLSGGLWSPAQLSAPPKLWLDDVSSITESAGVVSQWNDRTSNGWHCSQPTSGVRPSLGFVGSIRAITFSKASNTRLSNGTAGALNIHRNTAAAWGFVVFRRTATGSATEVLFGTATGALAGDARFRMDINSEKPRLAARRLDASSAETLLGGTTLAASQTYMMLMQIDYSVTKIGSIYVNGAVDASKSWGFTNGPTSDTASAGSLVLGSNMNGLEAYFGGSMIAALSGNGSVLGSGDIDKLFGWAAWRYGLQENLPSGHPYKDAPP